MSETTKIGLDIAKQVFHAQGKADDSASTKCATRNTARRTAFRSTLVPEAAAAKLATGASHPPIFVGPKTRRCPMQTANWAARIGAGFYILWGIFHLTAAKSVYVLAQQSTGMVRGRLLQTGFYLVFFAIAGILLAAILNWRNDERGYWMNGTLLAFADIPFILFVLVPRVVPWWPGLVGPLLWLAAFIFTSVGRFSATATLNTP